MGLDVIFVKDGKSVSWSDPIMQDFPFPLVPEQFPIYGDAYDQYMEIGYDEFHRIVEVCGMVATGSVSFRGRGYSYFCDEVDVPYNFYQDLTPEMLKDQTTALGTYLEAFNDAPATTELTSSESLGSIRNLYKVLEWAVSHDLGTEANY